MSKMYFTLTGCNHYFGTNLLEKGIILKLKKEPKNQDDHADYPDKMIALDLYRDTRVSLGYCAGMSKMTEEEFIQYLGLNEVSIFSFDSESEFLKKLENA